MTGVAAVGGLAVAAIFLLTGVAAAQLRATMVALLFVMDIWALGLSYAGGIVNWQTLTLAGVLVPAMIVGVHVGHRLFQRDMIRNAGQRAFRQRVSLLLFGLALAGLVRTLSTAYGG
jgi:uncharacterized membrane protein YfcA